KLLRSFTQLGVFQGLQWAKETMLVSNSRLAETSLSHKPELRNGKRWLAKKYQELDELTNIIKVKQNKLVLQEENSLHMVQCLLLNKLSRSEEECEDLTLLFSDGIISLDQFVETFQRSRKVYHVQLVQSQKIQEFMKPKYKPEKPSKNPISRDPPSVDMHLGPPPKPSHVFYGLHPAIILPTFYACFSTVPIHGPYLPPLSDHTINRAHLRRSVTPSFETVQHVGLAARTRTCYQVASQTHTPAAPAPRQHTAKTSLAGPTARLSKIVQNVKHFE
uniref:VPS37 C-terminal domain-containing protein n=1 Tax=Esox lucius TaxID=8010 RepID=A0A3P8Z500_ESOLU